MEKLDATYWNNKYLNQETGWDIGEISTPLKTYIDQLENKNLSILIPGCGNGYEVGYLLEKGFTNITVVDIAAEATRSLKEKYAEHIDKSLQIMTQDFFETYGRFDLILEQTFFCALHPSLRPAYVDKIFQLLKPGGKLAGVLFNRHFDENPPYGGSIKEYRQLFGLTFALRVMEPCYNSISPRKNAEVFIILQKVIWNTPKI
ncbi:methyltransferase domain-containing protein [Gynurincola endophyticus]|jgi:SAM-dependent methyltransferase|uniref:methyltransferase domain-containing protein n=1 Tax=Gynurincola endophyticus TaxID=2479004 RepID=UPI000F8F6D5B|nr:methyltransferase domain-containing protein [Gynurincola endophyticus]